MIKRKPAVWVELTGIEVIDADGWEHGTWETPITIEDFINRTSESTCRNFNRPKQGWELLSNRVLSVPWGNGIWG